MATDIYTGFIANRGGRGRIVWDKIPPGGTTQSQWQLASTNIILYPYPCTLTFELEYDSNVNLENIFDAIVGMKAHIFFLTWISGNNVLPLATNCDLYNTGFMHRFVAHPQTQVMSNGDPDGIIPIWSFTYKCHVTEYTEEDNRGSTVEDYWHAPEN